MRVIQFTAQGSSSVFGNFGPGDKLRCSDAEARHFVLEAQCAKYADEQAPAAEAAQQPGAEPARRARKAPAKNET